MGWVKPIRSVVPLLPTPPVAASLVARTVQRIAVMVVVLVIPEQTPVVVTVVRVSLLFDILLAR